MTAMRIMKGKREMPCCGQQVRVKIAAPGYYSRICPLCRKHNVFILEPVSIAGMSDTLRMRWLDEEGLRELYNSEREGLAHVDLGDL